MKSIRLDGKLLMMHLSTYQSQNFFEPRQYIKGNGKSLHIGIDSLITALLIVEDTEVKPQNSVYGNKTKEKKMKDILMVLSKHIIAMVVKKSGMNLSV